MEVCLSMYLEGIILVIAFERYPHSKLTMSLCVRRALAIERHLILARAGHIE